MQNPITSFREIRESYLTYLETAFRIDDPVIQSARRHLLLTSGTLCTDLFVEPLQKYLGAGKLEEILISREFRDLGFTDRVVNAIRELCLSGLLESTELNANRTSKYPLYKHQREMLLRGVQPNSPGIVTSGTGSGKTEAFLLPIFAQIIKEACSWPSAPGETAPLWWREASTLAYVSPRGPRYEAPSRPKAVRALLLYPMNALVEDQLVRLRRALDSDLAHSVMNKVLAGNRIYFGRYTSATPVTGWRMHPRESSEHKKRSQQKLKELSELLQKSEETYQKACARVDDASTQDTRFNFPRPLGCEVQTRWDMQESPPDILITNVSMLSTMLIREVDDSIFEQTRQWLETEEDAYFYLVLDELHLQRGSAGTEVSYLLRSLFQRLGLDKDRNRHKLRILASSASLPVEGPEREQSLRYLAGMFGCFGLKRGANREEWASTIVKGEPYVAPISNLQLINSTRLKAGCQKISQILNADNQVNLSLEKAVEVAHALGITTTPKTLGQCLSEIVATAGAHIASACDKNEFGAYRATSVSRLSERIEGVADSNSSLLEDLFFLRGLSEHPVLKERFSELDQEILDAVPRFRVHSFFRAIEGLFASPGPSSDSSDLGDGQGRASLFGELSVEPGKRYAKTSEHAQFRRVELLYCECCGTLFYGGQRSYVSDTDRWIELYPNDADVENLPEQARSNFLENRSAREYAIFLPFNKRFSGDKESLQFTESQGNWIDASYDPRTATIYLKSHGEDVSAQEASIRGWFYYVPSNPSQFNKVRKQTTNESAGSALPCQCPACGQSYRYKRRGRSSPVRGFRVGFSKTTQLLATALLTELRRANPEEQLVAFSDSRQDAANAAMDLETEHHNDVLREIIVRSLEEAHRMRLWSQSDEDDLERRSEELKKIAQRFADGEHELSAELQSAMSELNKLKNRKKFSGRDWIELAEIIEPAEPQPNSKTRPLLKQLVLSGIHPTDRLGITEIPDPNGVFQARAGARFFPWQQLFDFDDRGDVIWSDSVSLTHDLSEARRVLSEDLLKLTGQIIFSTTYFSLEETGWAYPVFALGDTETNKREDFRVFDGLLRILSDNFRYEPSDMEWVGTATEWKSSADIKPKSRGKKRLLYEYAQAYCSRKAGRAPEEILDQFFDTLRQQGHDTKGNILIRYLCIKVPDEFEPFWRCSNCGRVHLHIGGGICTRCISPLDENSPSGTCVELRTQNYLGYRISHSAGVQRMRSEELTGMTMNPASRLRRFKKIFIEDSDDILPTPVEGLNSNEKIDRAARVIDILSVTTTMEVGVDIGDLRGVFQANMPPQRFNYQQRVGRAGRRGQAFSFVLTVCRSKSHDLTYFRNPEAITGDPPPPPFLTSELDLIVLRMVRKVWLVAAFSELRKTYIKKHLAWPVDDIAGTPDNHGEFFRLSWLRDNANHALNDIEASLDSTIGLRDAFVKLCVDGDTDRERRILAQLTTQSIREDILELVSAVDTFDGDCGLAEALAEVGKLPMYGMPTRIRTLVTRPLASASTVQKNRIEFSQIDRDLDIAIQEFSPGRFLVQDKRRYFTAGYSGLLVSQPSRSSTFRNHSSDIGELVKLVQCPVCSAWHQQSKTSQCNSCEAEMSSEVPVNCWVPYGFISTLQSLSEKDEAIEESISQSGRSAYAEASRLILKNVSHSNSCACFMAQSRVFRLNRGMYDKKNRSWMGYSATAGTLNTRYRHKGVFSDIKVEGVWLDDSVTAIPFQTPGMQLTENFKAYPNKKTSGFYLAAPKTTDSLYIQIATIPSKLSFISQGSVSSGRLLTSAFRAGALSAMFMVVSYAAKKWFDWDPDEIEVIEPRVQMQANGTLTPLLQLSDRLVNGSGFCDRLYQLNAEGIPIIFQAISELLDSRSGSPVEQWLSPDHSSECLPACYQCLLRYGNQPYHGLLDWRLGLDVLQVLVDSNYAAGLDGMFLSPGIRDFEEVRRRLATEAALLFDKKVLKIGRHTVLDLGEGGFAVVGHPFWKRDSIEEDTEIQKLYLSAREVAFTDTFELSRRLGGTMQRLLLRLNTAGVR